jgi:hypothetical protein
MSQPRKNQPAVGIKLQFFDLEHVPLKRNFFLIRIVGCPRGTAAMYWAIVPVPGDCEDGEVGGMKCGRQGKPKYSEKICPGAILSTTNPT